MWDHMVEDEDSLLLTVTTPRRDSSFSYGLRDAHTGLRRLHGPSFAPMGS